MKKLFIIISTTLLFSCASNTKTSVTNSAKVLIDSIELGNVYNFYGSINFYTLQNALLITYLSDKKDEIYFVDEHKIIADSLPIASFLRTKSFNFFIDKDKILYALINGENAIYEYRDTNLVAKYTYYSRSSVPLSLIAFSNFEIINNTVLLHKIPDYRIFMPDERMKYFNSNLISLFALKDDSLIEKNNFVKFPEVYSTKFYNDFYPYIYRLNKDSAVYIFSADNNIYLYSLDNNVENRYPLSNMDANFFPDFNLDSIPYLSYSSRYELEKDDFMKIMRDEISKKYMIIRTIKIANTYQDDGYMPVYEDKPIQVNILDPTFTVKDKIYFENQFPDLMFFNSYYFNNKLYVPQFSKHAKTVIYVYKVS